MEARLVREQTTRSKRIACKGQRSVRVRVQKKGFTRECVGNGLRFFVLFLLIRLPLGSEVHPCSARAVVLGYIQKCFTRLLLCPVSVSVRAFISVGSFALEGPYS